MSFFTDDRRTGVGVHITLDGTPVVADSSQTILEVCLEHDIHIPTLCWHPKMRPIAACRLCLVKVEGDDRMTAACDINVQEGMSILTDTPEVLEHRKKAMNFVLLHHPLDCPECDKSGECDLQDRTVELGVLEQPYAGLDPNKQTDLLSPMVELVHTRCIVCGLCVEICQQVQGARAIDYTKHGGFLTKVGQTTDDGFACESCGQCITVCPVGVILDIPFKYTARPWELKKQKSICTHCSLGCTVVTEHKGEEVFRNTVDEYAGINEGNLCSLGRFGWDTVTAPTRIQAPAVRNPANVLEATAPSAAIARVAEELNRVKAAHGGGAIAGLVGPRVSNEEAYLFTKLLRRNLETNHIDTVTTAANTSLRRAARAAFGVDASPATLDDVKAADAILVVNSGLVNSHPMLVLELLDRWKRDLAKTIVTGSQVNKLSRDCGIFASNRPGTDAALLYGVLHVLFAEKLVHEDAAEARIANLAAVQAAVAEWTPERTEAVTGTPATQVRRMAVQLGLARHPVVVIGNTALHEYHDDARALAAVTIALVTGAADAEHPGVLLAFEGGNVQGVWDMGALPDRLPGHRPLSLAPAREAVSAAWERAISPEPGLDLDGIIDGIRTARIKALYVLGADLMSALTERGVEPHILHRLEFLVVQDTHGTALDEYAHVVLPAAEGPEREGTFTATYRTLQRQRRAVAPAGLAQPAVDVLEALAEATGMGLGPVDVTSVLKEVRETAPIYADVEIGALAVQPFTWPWAAVAAAKAPRIDLPTAPAPPEANGQLLLTVPLDLHTTDPRSLESRNLDRVRPTGRVDVHPEEAQAHGWREGTRLRLSANDVAVERAVHLTREVPRGALAVPLRERDAWAGFVGPLDPAATAPAFSMVSAEPVTATPEEAASG